MSSVLENSPSRDYKIWYGIMLFVIVCVTIFLIIIYVHPERTEQKSPVQITMQGRVVPLTAQDVIQTSPDQKIMYRIIAPIDPYNEVYILYSSSTPNRNNRVVYAKEKIACTGRISFTAREVGAMTQASVINGTEHSIWDDGNQLLIDTWECIR